MSKNGYSRRVKRPGSISATGISTETTSSKPVVEIYIKYDGLRFGIRFENEQRSPDAPLLSIGLGQKIYPERVDNANDYQERMTALLELQCRVATAADANYAPLFNPPDRYAMPEGRPIGEAVEDAPRLGVYSPTVLGRFGGPEALFEEPPWYTGELPD